MWGSGGANQSEIVIGLKVSVAVPATLDRRNRHLVISSLIGGGGGGSRSTRSSIGT